MRLKEHSLLGIPYMTLHELIYTSVAVDEPDVEAILAACLQQNPRYGITGCLVYDSVRFTFIQLFEGPEAAVDQLYRNICADTRHDNIYLLHKGTIGRRSFPDWHMRYVVKKDLDLPNIPDRERKMFAYLWQNPGLRVLERVNQFKSTARHEETPVGEHVSTTSTFDRIELANKEL